MFLEGVVLSGVVGSQAYGLATPTSDRDVKGIFVAPTRDLLGIRPVKDCYDHTDPDWSYYELGKFVGLALKCNPTITELLYLDEYETLGWEGRLLIQNRHLFLSETHVRAAFTGYAKSQVRKLVSRADEGKEGFGRGLRYEKHARHCFRLIEEARQLLTTGTMEIRVRNRDELFAVGKLGVEELNALFCERIEELDSVKSVLPERPDYDALNEIVLQVRGAHLW